MGGILLLPTKEISKDKLMRPTHSFASALGGTPLLAGPNVPVMATVTVRKKVVSVGHFSPSFCLQSLQIFFLVDQIKSNCNYVLSVLKIREK